MRDMRKILFVILTLLPLFAILLYAIGNIGNDTGIDMPALGSMSVTGDSNAITVSYTEGICETIAGGILPAGTYTGAVAALLAIIPMLAGYGIPIGGPVAVVAYIYMIYITIVEFAVLILDFITWIPRKCRDFISTF